MRNVDSKFVIGLLAGAAVGAAVGYLIASDKTDKIVEDLSALASKVKRSFHVAANKYGSQRVGMSVDEDELAE